MKKKELKKEIEELKASYAKVRAEKIEALAKIMELEKTVRMAEDESEDLIGIAAEVGRKLESVRPHVEILRKALCRIVNSEGLLLANAEQGTPEGDALRASLDVATVLVGPIVGKARVATCGAQASFQTPAGVASLTHCWAEHGHQGDHGDDQGRSWPA